MLPSAASMTIAAAYLISEGVVFGTDSTTTVTLSNSDGEEGVGQLFNHAQKVFEIGPKGEGRLGLCIWGSASIGEVAHRTIAARLTDLVKPWTTVEGAVDLLERTVNAEVARQGAGAVRDFGYFLGGVDPGSHLPKCYALDYVGGAWQTRRKFAMGEAGFRGAPRFFARTFHGFDPDLPDLLLKQLKQRLPSVANLDMLFAQSFMAVAKTLPAVGYNDVPLREAIDFVHTYLHVTVKAFKFQFGPPVCGGPLEIAFVSTDRPFRWARHKPFDAALQEPQMMGQP